MVLGTWLMIGVFSGSAGATQGSAVSEVAGPSRTAGIRACVDLGHSVKAFTIELRGGVLVETVYGDTGTGFEVEVTKVEQHGDGRLTFEFSSNHAIQAVFGITQSKQLPSPWDLPTTVAGLLTALPESGSSLSGQSWASVQLWASFGRSVSQITFCWDVDHPPTPPSQPSTTTSSSSTTTTQPATTTSSTTSQEQPVPTTTGSVPGPGSATTVPTTTTTTDGRLAFTGSTTTPLLVTGGVLLLGGSILLASTRLPNRHRD